MPKKATIIFLLTLLISSSSYSQNFLQRYGGIPFTVNGVNSLNPFNGGIDQPRFQMVDIDGDNDLDLFIFDKDTTLNFYRNNGNNQNSSFVLVSTRYLNLLIRNWFFFADMDADGDYDLFTGGDFQTIRYYKNTGNASNPSFVLFINELKSNTDTTIIGEAVSNHHVSDIDADGDLDLFLGSSLGTIAFYRNIGTPQNFNFQFVTNQFAGIQIIGGGDNNTVGTNLRVCPPLSQQDIDAHGANSIIFSDIDGDGDPDLFWGDYFQPSVYFIKNTGTPQNFNWTVIDSSYPHPSSWFSRGFNMPRFYDIDNDGKKDLFIGVLYGSQTINNFVYFKNIGPANNPAFSKMTENYIPNPDVGSNGFPAFTDIDNDGDFDIFIGSDHSTVAFYRNTGTAASPSFIQVTDSVPLVDISFNYAPCFGDLNGDNKKDLLLGAFDGKLRYFVNTSSVLSNPVFTFQASQFDTIDVGQSSTPALVDIDNDGDLDLFVGNWNGRISYYRNNGNASAFNWVYITNFYDSIDAGDESTLCFTDIDSDGDKDMFIGRRDGFISFYKNTGTASSPNFVPVTNNYAGIFVQSNSVPVFVDIDNDTDKDLFVGNIKGGLYYFENRDVIGITPVSNEIPKTFNLHQNYPNPFNPVTKIKFDIPDLNPSLRGDRGMNVDLKVYDLLGKEVAVLVNEPLSPGTYEIEFNAANLPSGIYFCRLESASFFQSKKMILIK